MAWAVGTMGPRVMGAGGDGAPCRDRVDAGGGGAEWRECPRFLDAVVEPTGQPGAVSAQVDPPRDAFAVAGKSERRARGEVVDWADTGRDACEYTGITWALFLLSLSF